MSRHPGGQGRKYTPELDRCERKTKALCLFALKRLITPVKRKGHSFERPNVFGEPRTNSRTQSPATVSSTALFLAATFPLAKAIAPVMALSGMNPPSFEVAGFSFRTTSR